MKKGKEWLEKMLLKGVYALGKSTACATSRLGGYEPEEDQVAYRRSEERRVGKECRL